MKKIRRILKDNYWIIDLIINKLNEKMCEEWNDKIYTRWNFQPTINNWARKTAGIKNKLLITEAINNILWTSYTVNDLEQEVEE